MDNKSFASALAKRMNCDAKEATAMIAAFASVLRDRTANLDSIAIPGFGNFVSIKEAEKIAIDQSNGRRMLLPPHIKIEFVASSMLKKQVDQE